MRGKLEAGRVTGGTEGITPADAGKTGGIHTYATTGEDHPRGCGENYIVI